MCDPASAGLALSVIGTGVSAFGQLQAGKAAQAQSNFQAQVEKNNAIIAERAAVDAELRGEIEAEAEATRVKQIVGRTKVGLAGTGQVISEGSAVDIVEDVGAAGALDVLTIRNNAAREALGFRTQGTNFTAQAQLLRAKGKSARAAGTFGAFSTILTGAGKAGVKFGELKKAGAFG